MQRVSRLVTFVISITSVIPTFLYSASVHSERYNALHQFLNNYSRTVTLAFLSDDTQVPFMIAKHHPSVSVIINPDVDGTLEKACYHRMHNRSTILLKTDVTPTTLRRIGECEHIDVCFDTTCLNQYTLDWQKRSALQALQSLAEYALIESSAQTYNFLLQEGGQPLANYYGHTLFLFHTPKTYLARRSWFKKAENNSMYSVESNFVVKNFVKKKASGHKTTPWVAGINLQTFRELNGVFPSKSRIRDLLYALRDIKHNDLFIFNLVIQGDRIVPIDSNESGRNKRFSSALRRAIAAFRYPWIHV